MKGSDAALPGQDGTAARAGTTDSSDHESLFPASSVLVSSEGAGWHDIEAQRLRLTLETPEHDHAEHFLTLQVGPPALIESKEGRHHRRVRTTPGDFTLIGADMPHQVRYEGADVLGIALTPALVNGVAAAAFSRDGSAADHVEFIPQHGTHDPQIERIGQLLKAELEAGCPTGPLFADGLAQALAAHLLRHYSTLPQAAAAVGGTEESGGGGLPAARLRRTLDFLEANLDRDVSLAEIAAAAGLSPFHFARQFKAATGMAPHAYLIARRVERAKELLSRSDLPIAAVAAATGFAHQSHLTRHFKRLVGVTPARFGEVGG